MASEFPTEATRSRGIAKFAVLAVVLAMNGCAADTSVLETLVVVPHYYDTLSCPDLVRQYQSSEDRMNELAKLMEKSGGGPGGTVANALAYDTDYIKARAVVRDAGEAARQKGCDLTRKVETKKGRTMPESKMQPRAAPSN